MPIPSEARWKAAEEKRIAGAMRRRKGLPEDDEGSDGGGDRGGGQHPATTMFDQVNWIGSVPSCASREAGGPARESGLCAICSLIRSKKVRALTRLSAKDTFRVHAVNWSWGSKYHARGGRTQRACSVRAVERASKMGSRNALKAKSHEARGIIREIEGAVRTNDEVRALLVASLLEFVWPSTPHPFDKEQQGRETRRQPPQTEEIILEIPSFLGPRWSFVLLAPFPRRSRMKSRRGSSSCCGPESRGTRATARPRPESWQRSR